MSSNGIVSISSFNLLFFTHVLTVLTTTIKYNEYVTDKGKNISIPCGEAESDDSTTIMWIKENHHPHGGSNNNSNTFQIVQTGTILVFSNITEIDAGIYICIKTDINYNQTVPSNSNDTNRMNNIYYINNKNNNQTSYLLKTKLLVRTTPGPVTQLYFKASTILGFLIWRFNKTNSGGYPIRSFTAEYRSLTNHDDNNVNNNNNNVNNNNVNNGTKSNTLNNSNNINNNSTNKYNNKKNKTNIWTQLDPPNIAPNVRQMEVYKLSTNSTYEFRIWANNKLGPGVIVSTNVTTLPDTKEEDLVRLIKDDIENFDVRVWIAAVGVVLGSLIILAIGVCVLMAIECYQSSTFGTRQFDEVLIIA